MKALHSLLVLIAFGLVGCAAGGPSADPAPFAEPGEACEVVYTPDAESLPFVEAAAARWSTATGCDIHVGPGGIPVVTAALLTNPAGKHPQGLTTYFPAMRIGLERGMAPTEGQAAAGATTTEAMKYLVAAHELGHTLGIRGEMTETGGLMSVTGDGCIHATELEVVCSVLDCRVFAPEAD